MPENLILDGAELRLAFEQYRLGAYVTTGTTRKVRIISDSQDRARIVAERDKVPIEQALTSIRKIDEQRRKWGRYL